MRDIKFRAFDKRTNQIGEVVFINFNTKTVGFYIFTQHSWIKIAERLVKEVELMQYTGLKDKNGVEIYDGDIIKKCIAVHKGGIKEYSIGEVYFESHCFVIRNYSNNEFDSKCIPLKHPLDNTINKYEVIGNIYENQELLKG